jgi:2-polyprenyl-6-methoxyphenol hydroxylase-like FAD-dependent oxidoreductase
MAGLALKAQGHNTAVLERNPSPLLRNQGAGIVAGGDTLAFKETMQFARLIQDRGVKMGTRRQFGKGVPLGAHIADRNLASKPRQRRSLSRVDEGQVTGFRSES